LDRKAAEDVAGFRDADAQIRRLIAREVEREFRRIALSSPVFHKGPPYLCIRQCVLPEGLAGVMALSSYFPRESSFSAERAPANNSTPIFMAHGQGDTVLPLAMGVQARNFLKAQGYLVEWHEYPMGHAVCAAEVTDIREFLFRVLS